ncbi:MAG: DUF5719 family protein [Actinobacteria bacterium]|jgi:hypothetical protein|nr:DUF5719 family protein [Actinomycetota bacterium]
MNQLRRSTLLALVFLISCVLFVGTFDKTKSGIRTIAKYPATVCPSNLGDGASTAVLPNSSVMIRSIPTKTSKLVKAGITNVAQGKRALFIDGNQSTSISVTRGTAGWLATTSCVISDSDQWFVGGSGSITSRASLDIVNSGLSNSVVDLFVYTAKGAQPINSQVVSPNSEKNILIDTLAPGEDSVVVHAVTRSGRVSIFYLDQRKKGLRSLGADFIFNGGDPAKHIVIPAILNSGVGKKAAIQILRVLAPGSVAATLKATIYSSDGSFAPIEIDGKSIMAGKVTDISFAPILSDQAYSLVLDSDVPIVAGVQTVANSEFTWSNSVLPFTNVTMTFGGLTPITVFHGKSIAVAISWTDVNGKSGTSYVTGEDFSIWSPKSGLKRATFVNNSKSYGGIIFKSNGGISALPVAPGASLESAAIPVADARVISRR